jgi:hypothetical protein
MTKTFTVTFTFTVDASRCDPDAEVSGVKVVPHGYNRPINE